MSEANPVELALARFEGKLDAWSMQQTRHEDRLNAHSSKLDAQQMQITELATRQATQQEAKRTAPSWATVVSAVVAAAMFVLFVAQQIYLGG